MAHYGKGTRHPSESRIVKDEKTGARVVQITQHPSINHNLYFLTSSFTHDMNKIIFASNRSGKVEFFMAHFPDGPIVQLTGREGIHGFSGTLSRDGSEFYYTARGAVIALHLDTLKERTLVEYRGAQLGECSLSNDGHHIVTAMKRRGMHYIVVTHTHGSGSEIIFECPRRIIHPQFHPTDPTLIEYAQDPAPRMWLIQKDGSGNTCLYEHGNDEFIVHETFLGRGDDLIFCHWPYALKKIHLTTHEITTIAHLNAWHISSNRSGTKVLCDTVHPDIGLQLVDVATGQRQTICYPNSSSQGTQWRKDRYALPDDWAETAQERESALSWMEMKGDTVYGPQWTHPHPSFSPDDRRVVYTSDVSGHPQVYVVEVPV